MNPKIFRDAANSLNLKARYSFGKISFSCEAISEASGLPIYRDKTEEHHLFHKIYKPETELHCDAYFGEISEENQLARALALDLLAEMIEQGDL